MSLKAMISIFSKGYHLAFVHEKTDFRRFFGERKRANSNVLSLA